MEVFIIYKHLILDLPIIKWQMANNNSLCISECKVIIKNLSSLKCTDLPRAMYIEN